MCILLTLCYYVIISIFSFTLCTDVIVLCYRGRKKVWAWKHERGIIAIRSRRNGTLFYAAALTQFRPCVSIYIDMLFLFSSILHFTSYLKFRGRNFIKGEDCDDMSVKIMIFIILINEFTKMPFEAKCWLLLTTMSYHVSIIFLGYPHSARGYECVGASGTRFGVITKEILTFKVEGKNVNYYF